MAHDVAEATRIERPPKGREAVPAQLSRLLDAHQVIIENVRELAERADKLGDDGTNDMLVSDLLRTNELQVWFVSEHLVDEPTVRDAEGEKYPGSTEVGVSDSNRDLTRQFRESTVKTRTQGPRFYLVDRNP